MTLDGAFAHLSTLTTNRLRIRQIVLADADAIFVLKSDPKVTRCYGLEPHQSVEETKAWVQRCLADYERHQAIVWAIELKGGGAAIGECCFWNIDPCGHFAEIGYELDPAHWHKGIMTEALTAVLAYGFADLGFHRIEANPIAFNAPSLELLQRLGFRLEGNLRQRLFLHGRYVDQLNLGLLEQEWSDRQAGA